jgi:hypothetical protein
MSDETTQWLTSLHLDDEPLQGEILEKERRAREEDELTREQIENRPPFLNVEV